MLEIKHIKTKYVGAFIDWIQINKFSLLKSNHYISKVLSLNLRQNIISPNFHYQQDAFLISNEIALFKQNYIHQITCSGMKNFKNSEINPCEVTIKHQLLCPFLFSRLYYKSNIKRFFAEQKGRIYKWPKEKISNE